MNIFVPNYMERFRVTKDTTLDISAGWRFWHIEDKTKDFSHIIEVDKGKGRAKLTLPKNTILEIKSIRVRNSEYSNFITFIAYHEEFLGIKYKTVGKMLIDVFEEDFKQLRDIPVEILEDTDN